MNEYDLTPLWKALADSKRRRIIQLLHECPRTTGALCAHFDVSRFAIMRHLKVLERSGLIMSRRDGRQRWNFVNDELFRRIQQTYLDGNDEDGAYEFENVLAFLARRETEGVPRQKPAIRFEVTLQAPADRVFRAWSEEINAWWSYRTAPDAIMHLEPRVGGRFYEAFDETGDGILYATVSHVRPGHELGLIGMMGLVEEAALSVIHVTIQSLEANTTRLSLTHRFIGEVSSLTVEVFRRSWDELLNQHLSGLVRQRAGTKAFAANWTDE